MFEIEMFEVCEMTKKEGTRVEPTRVSQLEHGGYVPLYIQLSNLLRANITVGEWETGHVIPTETELMEMYQVSRTTVREAITPMVNEGLLRRKQGKGTVVAKPRLSEMLGTLTGFSEEIRRRGMTPGARCLQSAFVAASARVANWLGCAQGALVFRTYRLRLANEEPIAVEESYWPSPIGNILSRHDLNAAAYYDVLEADGNIMLSYAEEVIRAVVASAEEAELLEVATGSALLQMERVTTSSNYGVIEYCRTRYRADRYDYRIRLQRSGA